MNATDKEEGGVAPLPEPLRAPRTSEGEDLRFVCVALPLARATAADGDDADTVGEANFFARPLTGSPEFGGEMMAPARREGRLPAAPVTGARPDSGANSGLVRALC